MDRKLLSPVDGARTALLQFVVALAPLLVAQTQPPKARGEKCVRPPAKAWAVGEVWEVPDKAPPCIARFVPTGVELVPDGRRVERIMALIARDVRGRYFTSDGRGQLAVWDSSGRWRSSFGRRGGGPGEFPTGALRAVPLPDGSVYVFDNAFRWTRFDSTLTVARSVQGTFGLSVRESLVYPGGRLLDATGGDTDGYAFHLTEPFRSTGAGRPAVVRRFGLREQRERALHRSEKARLVTTADTGSFWAGPPKAAGRGYELQLWRLDGTLLRTLRREVPWYPAGGDRAAAVPTATTPPPYEIESIVALPDDLLAVALLLPRAKGWDSRIRPDSLERDQLWDIRLEVLDTRSGTVLASIGPLVYSQAVLQLPNSFFDGTRLGFRFIEREDGEMVTRIVELQLRAP